MGNERRVLIRDSGANSHTHRREISLFIHTLRRGLLRIEDSMRGDNKDERAGEDGPGTS